MTGVAGKTSGETVGQIPAPGLPPAEGFFLPVTHGPVTDGARQRFCLYHAPHRSQPLRGAFLYIHPFAEEMNRSRRMAALQAHRLAAVGFGVLIIDLLGCGDSSGDFGDADWSLWKADLAAAAAWLENRLPTRIGLWGLRLGALLALDLANDFPKRFSSLLLWQPILDGNAAMTQFLRLRLGSDMLSDGRNGIGGGTRALREALLAGETLEIAGYRIAPALVLAIDRLKAETLVCARLSIHWIEILRNTEAPPRLSPAGQALAAKWRLQDVDVRTYAVAGPPFWATPEIATCVSLLELSTDIAQALGAP